MSHVMLAHPGQRSGASDGGTMKAELSRVGLAEGRRPGADTVRKAGGHGGRRRDQKGQVKDTWKGKWTNRNLGTGKGKERGQGESRVGSEVTSTTMRRGTRRPGEPRSRESGPEAGEKASWPSVPVLSDATKGKPGEGRDSGP